MRLAVFTHVDHVEQKGRFYAYAPYVREMNIWLRHVEEVEVVAPLRSRGRGDWGTGGLGNKETRRQGGLETRGLGNNGIPYKHSKLTFTEVSSVSLLNFLDAVKAIVKIPFIFFRIIGAMGRADHLHLRCPGNVGLLACLAQIFFPSKPKSAKYAGNWDPQAEQPWTYRLQKWILSNTFLTRNMQVLVYGEWPGQTKNIKSFFTASFSEEEKAEVGEKDFSGPFTFLFVGNLVKGKRPLEAVKLIEKLKLRLKEGTDPEISTSLEIYGNGPEREKLETYVREKQLEQFVTFKGSLPLEELKEAYQKAHFVILPSKSEGWPKAIAEGMFFGCLPIATPVSCVPWMLGYGERGILLDDPEQQEKHKKLSVVGYQLSGEVEKVKGLLKNPQEMRRMSEEAKNWSQQYTLEKFEEAIKGILEKSNEKSSSPFGRGGGVG